MGFDAGEFEAASVGSGDGGEGETAGGDGDGAASTASRWRKRRARRRAQREREESGDLDRVLAKIADSGLESLSFREKRLLRRATDRRQRGR